MTWTTISHGPDGTVYAWHTGDVTRQLADALPGWTVRLASAASTPAPPTAGRVVLVGYSAGCQGVRAALLGPAPAPEAVVTIDGTHASWPPEQWQLDVWRRLGERALSGGCLWVATTLGAHRYTERLPRQAVPRSAPYASTGHVLERALGYREGHLRTPQTIDSRGLHLRSYPSRDQDREAHIAQVREVLPEVWRDVVVPWLLGGHADTDPAPAPSGPVDAPPGADDPTDGADAPTGRLALGLRCLAWLGVEAVAGVRELPGARHDPRILAYSAECRRGGTFLGVEGHAVRRPRWAGGAPLPLARDEDPWCAALASASLLGALEPDEAPPHGLRVSVRELVEDARGTGALRLAGSGYEPQPGDLAILGRAGGDPLRGGTGHVHRVVQVDGARYLAIGGNESNEIRVDWHPRARVLAWIAYP